MTSGEEAAGRRVDGRLAHEALAALPGYLVLFRAVRAPNGVVSDLCLEFVNDRLAGVLGRAPEDLQGNPWSDVADSGDRESYELRLQTLAEGLPRTKERFSTTVGRWLRVLYFPVATDVVGTLSFDVTAERDAHRLLEDRERELRETQRIARVGTWNRDLATDTTEWSEQTFRLHGLDPGGPTPQPGDSTKFYEPASAASLLAAYERLKADGTSYEVEVRLKPAPGRARALVARGEAVRDDAGRIVRIRGTVVDVSERLGAEQKLDELRAELAVVSRRTVLGEVAGSLAHELNQPLAAILSDAEAAARLVSDERHSCEEIGEILREIAAQTERAAEIIRRLREQVRSDPPGREHLDLNQLVRETLQLAATEARHRGATATTELAEPLPPVFGDRVQLQQVLINLVLNALDAVEKTPLPRSATIRTWASEGRVWLSVTDSGPGIPTERLLQVFEPFYSTKPGGLGVGLSISRTLAEAHGGSLVARNAPGRGAVFVLSLPAAPPSGALEGPGR